MILLEVKESLRDLATRLRERTPSGSRARTAAPAGVTTAPEPEPSKAR